MADINKILKKIETEEMIIDWVDNITGNIYPADSIFITGKILKKQDGDRLLQIIYMAGDHGVAKYEDEMFDRNDWEIESFLMTEGVPPYDSMEILFNKLNLSDIVGFLRYIKYP